MKDSLYEENFKLHSENARLRKKLEQLESSLGIDRLRAHFEAEIKKQLHREEKLKKEADRYHRLWQDAVSELRSKGDIIELLIQLEDLQKLCDHLREEISALTKENIDKAQELIEGITNGKIFLSKDTIAGLTQKFSVSTEAERNRIFKRLLQYPVMYSDATNARVNGKSSFVIVCANENEMLYFFREHKGHEGLKGTPVEQYQQTLVHDHDKTYYNYGADHQECLAHVLRYLQDSIDNEPHLSWNSQMKEFLSSMIHETKENRAGLSDTLIESYYGRYDAILKLGHSEYQDSPPAKYYRDGFNLLKRMTAYRDNHLLFLTHPEIDYTDNLSERALRKYKRKQKQAVSFRCNSSVEFLCNAMSIIETRKLQGANIYNTVLEVFSPVADPSVSFLN